MREKKTVPPAGEGGGRGGMRCLGARAVPGRAFPSRGSVPCLAQPWAGAGGRPGRALRAAAAAGERSRHKGGFPVIIASLGVFQPGLPTRVQFR